MDLQGFFNILFSFVLTGIGGFATMLWNKTEKNSTDLSNFKEKVAEEYATNDDIERKFDKVDSKLDRISDKMDTLMDKIHASQ